MAPSGHRTTDSAKDVNPQATQKRMNRNRK